MSKRLPTTPRSKVKMHLRQLFLQSRERAAAVKRDKYTCQHCHRKQSFAKGRELKIQVHHLEGAQLEHIIDLIFELLLCDPKKLQTLCVECHEKETAKIAQTKDGQSKVAPDHFHEVEK